MDILFAEIPNFRYVSIFFKRMTITQKMLGEFWVLVIAFERQKVFSKYFSKIAASLASVHFTAIRTCKLVYSTSEVFIVIVKRIFFQSKIMFSGVVGFVCY